MDSELLVEQQILDGERLVVQLARDGFDVAVAFWARTSEEGRWYLYVGSNSVDPARIGDAYGKLYASLRRLPGLVLDMSQVKLVGTSSPVVRDALTIRSRHSGTVSVRLHGPRLGNLAAEEALIYGPAAAPGSPMLTVDAITNVELLNGRLRTEKTTVCLPKQGPPPLPNEWVSGIAIVGDRLMVEKTRIVQGPEGLRAECREELYPAPAAAVSHPAVDVRDDVATATPSQAG